MLSDLGIDFNSSNNSVIWNGVKVSMKDRDATFKESFHVGDTTAMEEATEKVCTILKAKYEAANLRQICNKSSHLDTAKQERLFQLLNSRELLFNGKLGNWQKDTYDIDLKEDAKSYDAKAFPIPYAHLETLKAEVERLCKSGVLMRVNRSEWAAPTFIIPKKDGSDCFMSKCRELNKRLQRKPYPIPKTQTLLLQVEGFQHANGLDLNIGYYHSELNPDVKKLHDIGLPYGKSEYQRLPTGLCSSPDVFQKNMSNLIAEQENVRVYTDDLLVNTLRFM